MQDSDPFDPEFKTILGDVLAVRFKNLREATDWAGEERKFYGNIMPPAANQDQAVGHGWNQINSWFNNFEQKRQQYLGNSRATPEGAKPIIQELLNRYTSGTLIYSQSTWGSYVAQLASSDSHLAARVLILLGNIGFQMQQAQIGPLWLKAGVVTEALRNGWLDQKPAADQGLTQFRQQWELKLQAIENSFSENIVASSATLTELNDERKTWETRRTEFEDGAAQLSKKLSDDTDKALQQGTSDIENFKKTYNSALSLRAPTQYWSDKGHNHRNAAFAWLGGFLAVAAAGALGCWFVWHDTVEIVPREPTYTAYLPTLGAAALAAWLLRICSRRALSNFALSADAGERVAMVQTYLALSEGGHATEAERGLILSALFRPAAKTTDDAAPPTWLDLISKERHSS
jgi:hypothetical protein